MRYLQSFLVLLFLVSFGLNAQENKENTTKTYMKVGYSNWIEHKEDKQFLMQEKSVLLSLGKEGTISFKKITELPLTYFIEGTAGITYYNGSEIFSFTPKKAIEAYAGVRGEIISHKHIVENNTFSFGPMFGVGNTVFVKTTGPEIWNELYVKAGAEGVLSISNSKIFMSCGAVQPLLVINHGLHLNISFIDGVYLPHGHTSIFGEIGLITKNNRKISLHYDSLNLGSSPAVKSREIGGTRTIYFVQPDTRVYTVSLKFSYRFKPHS